MHWGDVSAIIGVVVNIVVVVWWASKITAKMDSNKDALVRIERDLEKRDDKISAAFRKIDNHEHRLTIVETKCKVNHKEDEDDQS